MLQGGGHDEVAPAGEDAGALRPVERLAAGEGHQVGADLDEAAQVGLRRQLRGRVDDHRHTGGVRDLHDLGQWRAGRGVGDVEHGGGPVGDGVGDLPAFGIAHAGAGIAVRQPDLDQAHAGGAHRVVIEVALAAHHDDLVLHAGGVGQARHPARLQAGHAGGGREREARRRAGGDVAGLRAGHAGDHLRGVRLQAPPCRRNGRRPPPSRRSPPAA